MRVHAKPGILFLFTLALLGGVSFWLNRYLLAADTSSFEAEKARALASPYANDLGPEAIDVSAYPPEHQRTYKELFAQRCARCHSPARPLNSQFIEPEGKGEGKAAKIAEWKQSDPDLFKDKNIWQIETNVWERYVKRMMAKPGCNIAPPEGKAIWKFLVYDSNRRKLGANKAKWAAHRQRLLADFKAKYPARYKELYEAH